MTVASPGNGLDWAYKPHFCQRTFLRSLRMRAHSPIIRFRVSRRRREMYCGHARLCVCLSAAACPHYCRDTDVTWRNGRVCPLVVHYLVDLQSVHGLRCYGNITRTRNVSEYTHVLALCLVNVCTPIVTSYNGWLFAASIQNSLLVGHLYNFTIHFISREA